jgi:hypothetical protein
MLVLCIWFVGAVVVREPLSEGFGDPAFPNSPVTASPIQLPQLGSGFCRFAHAANSPQLQRLGFGFFQFARAANPTQLPKLGSGFSKFKSSPQGKASGKRPS